MRTLLLVVLALAALSAVGCADEACTVEVLFARPEIDDGLRDTIVEALEAAEKSVVIAVSLLSDPVLVDAIETLRRLRPRLRVLFDGTRSFDDSPGFVDLCVGGF